MARVFKLYDGTNTLSMITGQVIVVSQHYIPPVTDIPGDGSDPPSIIEVIPVEVVPTSADNLAATMQTLDLLRKKAAEYKVDRNQKTPVWLHQKLDGESGERRYLVERVSFEWGRNIYSEAPVVTQSIPATLTVTRRPYAERTSSLEMPVGKPSGIRFDAGTTELTLGETLTGDPSGDTGVVAAYVVTSGTWGGNNAAGVIYFLTSDGVFADNDQLNGSSGGQVDAEGVRIYPPSSFYDYTAVGGGGTPAAHDIVGDVGARISEMQIYSPGHDAIDRVWLGLRSVNRHGTVGNFVPVWELEEGTLGTDAALAADVLASPGGAGNTKVTITPGTATWAERQSITINQVVDSANYSENFGQFLWLLGCQVSAGEWEVQLRYGYSGGKEDDDFARGKIVTVSNTTLDVKTMDINVTPGYDPSSDAGASLAPFYEIQVWARRTSGAGTFSMDCLLPIPVDEGYLIISGANLAADQQIRIYDYPRRGGKDVLVVDDSITLRIVNNPAFEPFNFALPPGDGRIIMAYARASTYIIADIIALNLADSGAYYERWANLRGAE